MKHAYKSEEEPERKVPAGCRSRLMVLFAHTSLTATAFYGLASMISVASAQQVVTAEEHCVVNVRADDALNLRVEPDADSPVVIRVGPNECGVIVTGVCGRYWCPVETKHNKGWVNRRYISIVSPSRYCVSGLRAYEKLELRTWPSPESKVLLELPSYQCNIALLPFAKNIWQKIRVAEWEG